MENCDALLKLESFPSELIQCYLIKMPDLRGNIDVLKSSNSQEYFQIFGCRQPLKGPTNVTLSEITHIEWHTLGD